MGPKGWSLRGKWQHGAHQITPSHIEWSRPKQCNSHHSACPKMAIHSLAVPSATADGQAGSIHRFTRALPPQQLISDHTSQQYLGIKFFWISAYVTHPSFFPTGSFLQMGRPLGCRRTLPIRPLHFLSTIVWTTTDTSSETRDRTSSGDSTRI